MPAGAPPSAPARGNVPAALTGLVGRDPELAELARLLDETRLLTLTGAGGVGKTRLALAAAQAAADDYPDGVWLVELAAVLDPVLVPRAVADVFRVRDRPGRPPLAALVAHLRGRRLLLLLDNCEHLLDTCARLADALLHGCPGVRVLATSREVLGIAGEVGWRVPSLAAPPPDVSSPERLPAYAAVHLFLDRAQAARPDFALTPRNAAAVAEICRRLDGIPLALELAAARVTGLTPEQIAARLDDRFRLLTTGSRTALLRQQTLRATVEWSYALLDERERALFGRLAVFAGGFALEAVEAVGAGDGVEPAAAIDLLLRLVDKSLVVAADDGHGAARYRLLETLRLFAWERLVESGEEEAVRARHAAYCLALAEAAEPRTYPAETRGAALEQLARAQPDLRLALRWLHARGERGRALRLAAALGNFWYHRDAFDEGRAWLALVLDADREHEGDGEGRAELGRARARARHGLGRLALWQGDLALAAAQFEANLPYFRALDDRWEVAHTLAWLGFVAQRRGAYAVARLCFEEELALYRETGDRTAISWALHCVGCLAVDEEDYAAARPPLEEGLRLARALGEPHEIANMLSGLGQLDYQQGRLEAGRSHLDEGARLYLEVKTLDSAGSVLSVLGHLEIDAGRHAAAHDHLRRALAIHAEVGNRPDAAQALEGVARLAAAAGRPAAALCLAGAAAALREAIGAPLPPFWAGQLDRAVAAARRALDADAADAAWGMGRSLSLEEAVAEALAVESPSDASPPSAMRGKTRQPADPLTAREREVAALVTQGLTNRQIAAALSISDRTVETHLTNILGKLGLTGRAQVAAWSAARAAASAGRG
jgi:predicted ATPase/DNA-binding CsgD family transcriptional regulator